MKISLTECIEVEHNPMDSSGRKSSLLLLFPVHAPRRRQASVRRIFVRLFRGSAPFTRHCSRRRSVGSSLCPRVVFPHSTLSPPPMSDDIESQSHRPMIPASSSRPARPTGAAHPRGRSSACAALSDCLFSCWLWLRGAAHSCCGCCCSKTIRLHASGRTLRSVRLLAEGGFSYVCECVGCGVWGATAVRRRASLTRACVCARETVDLVEDVKSRVPYALKVMLCHTAEQAGRARWEAEVHQSFHHPNLLALEDVDFQPVDGGDKEHAYFLFDYMPRWVGAGAWRAVVSTTP